MNYCPYCNQMVTGRKHINWFLLILATFFTSGFWLLIYIPYYIFFKSSSCPLCGCEKLQ